MEITREFLVERKKQFEAHLERLRDDFSRFSAVIAYTDELIEMLDKQDAETASEEKTNETES